MIRMLLFKPSFSLLETIGIIIAVKMDAEMSGADFGFWARISVFLAIGITFSAISAWLEPRGQKVGRQ